MPLLSSPLTGTIKWYNAEKCYGFIKPEVPRPDGKDVFFHRNNVSEVHESAFCGELVLPLDTWLERDPHKGEKIIYIEQEKMKGPQAFNWTYKDLWDVCMSVVRARPQPNELRCRIVDGGTESNRFKEKVTWEGWRKELEHHLDTVTPDLSGNVWVEELKAQGWERSYHPTGWHPKYKPAVAAAQIIADTDFDRMTEEDLLRELEGYTKV